MTTRKKTTLTLTWMGIFYAIMPLAYAKDTLPVWYAATDKTPYYQREDVRAALRTFDETQNRAIEKARVLFRAGDFANAVVAYREAANVLGELPADMDRPAQAIHRSFFAESAELGDALAALGKTDEAIQAYRRLVYTPRPLGQWQPDDQLAFIATLPEVATDLADAKKRFPETQVSVWLSNTPAVLSRYAALLVATGQKAEAIAVYRRALQGMVGDDYQAVLEQSNLSVANFDTKRFLAALHVMFARGGDKVIWYGYYKQEEMTTVRESELEKAVRLKPDYAPALIAYAENIRAQGNTASPEARARAKRCLEQAEGFARSEAQRKMAREKYIDSSHHL